jgi:hypothetical protein
LLVFWVVYLSRSAGLVMHRWKLKDLKTVCQK